MRHMEASWGHLEGSLGASGDLLGTFWGSGAHLVWWAVGRTSSCISILPSQLGGFLFQEDSDDTDNYDDEKTKIGEIR